MYYDRFDIIEAHYLFFAEYHEGQFSVKYRRLCKLLTYFNPSPIFSYESMSDNAQNIYLTLSEAQPN